MQLKCSQEDLSNVVQTVQKAVSARSTLPILTGIKLKTGDNKIILSATDLEIAIREEMPVRIISQGEAVIPARLLGDIVRNLPKGEVGVGLDKSSGQLNITCGQAQFDVKGFPVEDFPEFPKVKDENNFIIQGKEIISAVKQVVKAASRDETRPILTGVLFLVEDGKGTMVATDSYRLAIRGLKFKRAPKENVSVIIPSRALEEFMKIISDGSKEIEVALSENQVVFKTASTTVISRLIEGQFPNYKQLLPQSRKTTFETEREAFVGAVKRTAILAQNTPLKLTVGGNKVRIAANTSEVGGATEDVGGKLDGEPAEMAFNAQYLLDGIASVSDERVRLELIDPLKPGIIRPNKEKNFLYLIMPVRPG